MLDACSGGDCLGLPLLAVSFTGDGALGDVERGRSDRWGSFAVDEAEELCGLAPSAMA